LTKPHREHVVSRSAVVLFEITTYI